MTMPYIYTAETTEIRKLVREKGGDPAHLTNNEIVEVFKKVRDLDLAACAIVMWPRPDWVERLVPGDRGQIPPAEAA